MTLPLPHHVLGKVDEICIVTADLERTASGLMQVGIGPWRCIVNDTAASAITEGSAREVLKNILKNNPKRLSLTGALVLLENGLEIKCRHSCSRRVKSRNWARTLQQFHIYTGHDTILTFLYSPSSFSSTSMISSLAQSRNSSIIRRRGASGG